MIHDKVFSFWTTDKMYIVDKHYSINLLFSSPPLKFSSRHGDNCQILRDGSQAKRAESFCKGEQCASDHV